MQGGDPTGAMAGLPQGRPTSLTTRRSASSRGHFRATQRLKSARLDDEEEIAIVTCTNHGYRGIWKG